MIVRAKYSTNCVARSVGFHFWMWMLKSLIIGNTAEAQCLTSIPPSDSCSCTSIHLSSSDCFFPLSPLNYTD